MLLSVYLSCQWRPENHGAYGFWELKFNIGIAPESLLKADRHGCQSPVRFHEVALSVAAVHLEGVGIGVAMGRVTACLCFLCCALSS